MIYCQLRGRASVAQGQPLRLADVAGVSPASAADGLTLRCPDEAGVWRVTALDCARALQRAYPQRTVSVLGAGVCLVRRLPPPRRDRLRYLRTALAMLILFAGSALGMAWFHSDVDMPAAQLKVYRLITGREPSRPEMITVPYAVGVAAGAAAFYALLSPRAVTPLDVHFSRYRADTEQAESRDVP